MLKGSKHTPETVARISAAKKRTLPHNTGKVWSEAVRARISATKQADPLTKVNSSINGKLGLNTKQEGASSKYLGVSWCSTKRRWHVKLYLGKGQVVKFGGYFDDPVRAALKFDDLCREYAPDRKLNFPTDTKLTPERNNPSLERRPNV
jgi:hypothetical protein